MNQALSPFVDAAFPLRGRSIPMDHGYPLFAALCRYLPALRQRRDWAVHPVLGQNRGNGVLELIGRSQLRIRLPGDEVGQILGLVGKSIDVAGNVCRLGFPRLFPLRSTPYLQSRLAIIQGFADCPESFAAALRRQIAGLPDLGQDPDQVEIQIGPRRILRIKGHPVPGYAVGLAGLEAHGSIAVQRHGLGGRRHMGAGVFVPPRRNA